MGQFIKAVSGFLGAIYWCWLFYMWTFTDKITNADTNELIMHVALATLLVINGKDD